MEKGIKLWIRAIRPFSLTGALIPVILGGIMAIKSGCFYSGYFSLSIIAILLLQAGANLINDSEDFLNKVDTKYSFGSSGVIVENLLPYGKVAKVGGILITIGFFIGLYLSFKRGILVFLLGSIGALGGYFYTKKPFQLKYKGVGIPMVFFLFGPLAVAGAYYVQTKNISSVVIYLSIPIGLLTTAILHANDIRDIYHDKRAGIKTLSIIIGERAAKIVYCFLLLLAYLLIFTMVLYKIIPIWSGIVFITMPVAVKNIKELYKTSGESSSIKVLDQHTAKLQAQFGGLLILSIVMTII